MRYAKIFDSMWDGSLRGHPDPLLVFVNLLTHSDEHGIVDRHWRVIVDETGLSRERVQGAIRALEAEDSESRTPDEGGRRIVRLDDHRDWGWRIVNHRKYRELCTKAQNAERVARHRAMKAGCNAPVMVSNAPVTERNIVPVGVGVGDSGIQDGVKGKDQKPATSKKSIIYSEEFKTFWSKYPNRVAKASAWKAWQKIAEPVPDVPHILAAIAAASKTEQWTKENGKYIPHPATWLNARRWEDEIQPAKTNQPQPTQQPRPLACCPPMPE